jgi:hypothetical protein
MWRARTEHVRGGCKPAFLRLRGINQACSLGYCTNDRACRQVAKWKAYGHTHPGAVSKAEARCSDVSHEARAGCGIDPKGQDERVVCTLQTCWVAATGTGLQCRAPHNTDSQRQERRLLSCFARSRCYQRVSAGAHVAIRCMTTISKCPVCVYTRRGASPSPQVTCAPIADSMLGQNGTQTRAISVQEGCRCCRCCALSHRTI